MKMEVSTIDNVLLQLVCLCFNWGQFLYLSEPDRGIFLLVGLGRTVFLGVCVGLGQGTILLNQCGVKSLLGRQLPVLL